MHEDTRRRLMRAAFVLFCLAPTVGVLGWTLVRSLPLQTRRLEHELRLQLGVRVRIGRLSHLRPGQVRLSDVSLASVEAREPLVQIPRIDAQATVEGWQLVIPELTMTRNALAVLWETTERRWLRENALARQIAHLRVDQVTVDDEAQPLVLRNVKWIRGKRPVVQRSQLYFALDPQAADSNAADSNAADSNAADSNASGSNASGSNASGSNASDSNASDRGRSSDVMRIDLQRDRSEGDPVTRLVLDTRDASLPISLVAAAMGRESSTDAHLRGQLLAVWHDGRWQADFVGQIIGVDLSDLSPTWIPYKLRGTASLEVERCTFNARGLEVIQGKLHVVDLIAPHEMIDSLTDVKLFARGPAYAAMRTEPTFSVPRLDVSFGLGNAGLHCKGYLDRAGLRVVLSRDTGIILISDGYDVRVSDLVSALFRGRAEPMYEARARLLRHLPVTLRGL